MRRVMLMVDEVDDVVTRLRSHGSADQRASVARRSSRASLSGWDGAAHVPGPRRQAEWTGRRPEPLGRAALEALAPRVVECPVEAAEIADVVRERVPEVIEVGVVGAGVDLAELDLLKPGGAPELLELMRARERLALVGPERTCKLHVDVECGIPDRSQQRHAFLEVPDAGRDRAAWPRNSAHLRRAPAASGLFPCTAPCAD